MENQNDLPQGANFEKMKQMLDPKNIGQTMRMFMCLNQEDSVAQFIEMADLSVEGPELVAVSSHLDCDRPFLNFSAPSNSARSRLSSSS